MKSTTAKFREYDGGEERLYYCTVQVLYLKLYLSHSLVWKSFVDDGLFVVRLSKCRHVQYSIRPNKRCAFAPFAFYAFHKDATLILDSMHEVYEIAPVTPKKHACQSRERLSIQEKMPSLHYSTTEVAC